MIQIQLLLSKILQRQLFIVNLLRYEVEEGALPASYYYNTSERRECADFFEKIVANRRA